jgi:hypothetical protein
MLGSVQKVRNGRGRMPQKRCGQCPYSCRIWGYKIAATFAIVVDVVSGVLR